MENLKISDNGNGGAQSSSPTDHERHSKQQKHKKSNSSSLKTSGDDWGFERMRKAVATLRKNLSQTGGTSIQNRKPRTQAKRMPEEEKNVLEKHLQINKDIIKQLQEDLETLITRAHDARAAQAAAKTELSQLKTTMTQHIAAAVAFLQGETAKQEELFKEKISALEKELVHMEWLRQQVILLEEQRQKSTSKLRDFKSISTRVTTVASKDEYYDLIQENEILKFQLQALREEKDELEHINADKGQKTTNISRNVEESSSDKDDASQGPGGNDNREDGETSGERKNEEPDPRISLGRYNGLVSDRRFLEMDWSREYGKPLGSKRLRCKRCPIYYRKSSEIKDHVWYKHYGEKFICPYCISPCRTFAWRPSLRKHIRDKHPSIS